MQKTNYGLDQAKLNQYKKTNKYEYSVFIKWFEAHKNTNMNESSMLKNVYNTRGNMLMIAIYKKLRVKVINGVKYSVKLQGRGSRKGFNYDSNRSLRLSDSERFSLYFYQI